MATKKTPQVIESITGNTTLTELSAMLSERALSATIYTLNGGYAVWAFAADDPALGIYPGEGGELADAMRQAIAAWDMSEIEGEGDDEDDDEGEAGAGGEAN